MDTAIPRGIVTLAFTDLEDSSVLAERHREAYEQLCDEHFRLLRTALKNARGYEVDTAGDSLFAVFSSAAEALQFAVETQKSFAAYNWPDEIGPLKVRIGLHTGEPFIGIDAHTHRPTFRGPATNRTARVMAAAHGGQILLSGATQTLVQNHLPEGVSLLDCGRHRLKGVGEEQLWQVCHQDLRREFPPPATLNATRHNLPLPPTPFIGREAEIEDWQQLLLQPSTRLLTLFGFGGLGKTRSALQLCESCLAQTPGFKDGIWWVNLEEAGDVQSMTTAIAAVSHTQINGGSPPLDQLCQALREQQSLIVLDNTEQIPQASQVVNQLLQGTSHLKLLVTTRHKLGLRAEIVREVRPLNLDLSMRLFAEYVQQQGAWMEESDPAIRALCRRMEGVPLALELAASRIGSIAPAQLLERFDDQLRLLKSKAPDLPPRQRTIRTVIDWSYDLLSPEIRELFAGLSVFAGGFELEDAEALAPERDVFDDIEELYRVSMLRATSAPAGGRTRYSLLESLRAYAAEKLKETADGGVNVQQRHARHFRQLMEQGAAQLRTGAEAKALTACLAQLDNARAALRFAAQSADWELTARLGLASGRILHRLGLFQEAAHALQTGLDALTCESQENQSLRAALILERANAHYDAFEWDKAEALTRTALDLYEATNDLIGQAHAKNLQGLIQSRSGNHTEAVACFEFALDIFTRHNLPVGTALAQQNLGLVANRSGDTQGARFHWQQALEVYHRQGFDRGAAEISNNLGVLAQQSGDLEEAWRCYHVALDLECKQSHQYGIARAFWNLAEVALMRGEHVPANRFLVAAEILFERSGSPYHQDVAALRGDSCLPATQAETEDELIIWKDEPLPEIVAWARGVF